MHACPACPVASVGDSLLARCGYTPGRRVTAFLRRERQQAAAQVFLHSQGPDAAVLILGWESDQAPIVRDSSQMHRITATLAGLGGVAQLSALVQAGHTPRSIQRLVQRGQLVRPRRGWYALGSENGRSADTDIVRAIRVGGRLACISACRKYGIWTPMDGRLHVSVKPESNHLKSPGDSRRARTSADGETVLHWNCSVADSGTRSRLPPLSTALADAMSCQPADVAFAMVDSAMHRGLLSDVERWELYHQVPLRCRASVAQADGASESGTESLFAFRMRALGIVVQAQVDVGGVGRVDFVIGDCLIVEIDSEQHHGSAVGRRRDLHRDAVAAALGFITLRFDYWQIMEDWATVEAAVLASVARGDHSSTRHRMP